MRAKDGSFWLVDEYGPSLVHVSARGKVLTRYVPKGLKLTGTDYPVVEALPAVLLHRKTNRGLEGLAQLPDGDLVLALQSPLSLPDADAGRGVAHDAAAALLPEEARRSPPSTRTASTR